MEMNKLFHDFGIFYKGSISFSGLAETFHLPALKNGDEGVRVEHVRAISERK